MTQEEKAKAYDELLVKLQKAKVDNNVCDDRYCCVIDDIVPELKESEDERMRNAAINACKYMVDNFENSTKQYEDAIAWLEKQSEQKKSTKEKLMALSDGKQHLGWLDDADKVIESEQKPADNVEPKFKVKYAGSEYNVLEVKDIAGVTYYGIEDEPNHIDYVQSENCEIIDGYGIKKNGCSFPTKPIMFSEQNPAWSEEDERNLYYWLDNNKSIGNDKYRWLLSLKDRVQPQPKQEWSEEDEKEVAVLEAYIRSKDWSDRHIDRALGIVDKLVNKVKSLRPQNTWKQSDRELGAILTAVGDERQKGSDVAKELLNIYQQLKKLREE